MSAGSMGGSADEEEEEEDYDDEEYEGEEAGDADEAAEEADEAGGKGGGIYNPKDVNDQVFEELVLGTHAAEEVQESWSIFLKSASSREAAGEAIYGALFDSAPSLQSLFKTPRAVMAMRFMNGLNQIISNLHEPKALKVLVETLGFQHLDLEVTVPRVVIFREAIVDLLGMELGGRLTKRARDGFCTTLNYVGGAYIYVRVQFAGRLKILSSSWITANNKEVDEAALLEGNEDNEQGEGSSSEVKQAAAAEAGKAGETTKKKGKSFFGAAKEEVKEEANSQSQGQTNNSFKNTSVPTTYNEMFMFNAAVMGFGQAAWMNEVLASFDTIVTNVASSYRLQEECDVLSLRIAKYKGTVNLPEYKAVMLASLRSLVPKNWNSAHEVAWSWLWENVERMIKSLMGKPSRWQNSLEKLFAGLDESAQALVRREVYAKFFTLAPAGQDFFKQSTTRLHFIADRITSMTLEIFKDPKKMVEDISALGLRHVGYGIPTDLFGPFVTACVQVIRELSDDDVAVEAFRWSLSLISRVLVRVITEGSTIVMKAINQNSGKALKKAVGCAPRGKRALWVLNVQVGTQSISPLLWAIETGSLDAAKAIIEDLLTIRADRDRYYYGMDTLFERHEDIVKRLCMEAPALLPTLLDGLVWRSRTTENGQRRVNYYVKHLMVDSRGEFAKAIEWVTENGDPQLVCHPVIAMVTDIVWSRIAFRTFLFGKAWILVTLLVFIVGTALLKHINGVEGDAQRIAVFACRCFIYLLSLGQWLYFHCKHFFRSIRSREFGHIGFVPVPAYLLNAQDAASFVLMGCLVTMLTTEPIIHCLANMDGNFEGSGIFTANCPAGQNVHFVWSVAACLAMFMYFALTIDLSVFSTKLSAYVLVCTKVLSEVGLFLVGLTFFILAFACAVSAIDHGHADFAGIPDASLSMLKITLGMFSDTGYEELHADPALMIAVTMYVICTIVFLLNMLIAQLSCSYAATYQDMVGFARLNRGKIVTEAMSSVSDTRWSKFIGALQLEERCEFGEGDIGLAGGIQVMEPASANITTIDMIRRFGGSTSTLAQWPEDDSLANDDDDRFERMEKLIEKALKRMSSGGGSKKGKSSKMGSTLQSSTGQSLSNSNGSDASVAE